MHTYLLIIAYLITRQVDAYILAIEQKLMRTYLLAIAYLLTIKLIHAYLLAMTPKRMHTYAYLQAHTN